MPLYLLSDIKTLVFSPLPIKDVKAIYTQFSPMTKYLEEKLAVKIKFDYNNSYEQILEKFKNKEIDIAYLGPLPYLSLKKIYPDVVPIVIFKNEKGETSYTCSFVSFISNNNSIENMEDKKIALTQALSTCGFLFVNRVLSDFNTDIEKNKYMYLGRHDKVALSVIRGEFDYGGLKTDTAIEYFHLGLKEIERSLEIPNFILVANGKTMDKKMLENIKKSMLLINNKDLSQWDKNIRYGVKEVNPKDYDYLKELIEVTKISPEGNFNER